MYDLLVRGGRVIDGTGGPWFRADVAVVGDRIVAMGHLEGREAARVIDAAGLFVTPGFVEEHSHSDVTVLVDPHAQSASRQGITTLVVGLCGMSAAPVTDGIREEYRRAAPLFDFDGYEWTWESMGGYLDAVRAAWPSVNIAVLAGHMPVRTLANGGAERPATPDERSEMRKTVERALEEGARGFSTGLTYQHTTFADTEEIVETAKALKGYGFAYHTHMRNQAAGLFDSLREAVEIVERAGCPLVVSHLYPVGRPHWGQAEEAIRILEEARDRGVEVGYDVTPWLRGGGPLAQNVPKWAREGGLDAMLDRLRDDDLRPRIAAELATWRGDLDEDDWCDYLVYHTGKQKNETWIGRSIGEIAEERGLRPGETAMLMLAEDDAGFWIAPTIKSEPDVDALIKHPMGVPVADALALSPEGPLANKDRPNAYGTFPRVLGRYVRERGVLTWEEAVQKMTSIPANRLGLWDRGVLRPGLAADIVVFDPETVIEKADYDNPQQYPEGIPWVVVNGRVTVALDGHTGARAGKVL